MGACVCADECISKYYSTCVVYIIIFFIGTYPNISLAIDLGNVGGI